MVAFHYITAGAAHRLWGFLLVSLALHAVLLFTWETSPSLTVQPNAPISVTLRFLDPAPRKAAKIPVSVERQPSVTSKPPPTKTPITARRAKAPPSVSETSSPNKKIEAKPESAPPQTAAVQDEHPADTASAVPQTANIASPNTGPASRAERTNEAARAKVEALLRADLDRHFTYPRLAQLRDWQGTVTLSVLMNPDGEFERIRVVQSSGYDILDRSAMETMRRIRALRVAKPWLNGRTLELPLPILYRLRD